MPQKHKSVSRIENAIESAYMTFCRGVRNHPRWKDTGARLVVPQQGKILGRMYRESKELNLDIRVASHADRLFTDLARVG